MSAFTNQLRKTSLATISRKKRIREEQEIGEGNNAKDAEKIKSKEHITVGVREGFKRVLHAHCAAVVTVLDQVIPVDELKDVCEDLLNVFGDNAVNLTTLFESVLQKEVDQTTDQATLFRGSSLCTKLISTHMATDGK